MSAQGYARWDPDASSFNAGCSSCQPGTHSPAQPPYSDPRSPHPTASLPSGLGFFLSSCLPFLLLSPPGPATVVDSGATQVQVSLGETFGRTPYSSAIRSPAPSGFWWMTNPQAETQEEAWG